MLALILSICVVCCGWRLFSVLTFGIVCACLRLLCVMAVCIGVYAPHVCVHGSLTLCLCVSVYVCVYPKCRCSSASSYFSFWFLSVSFFDRVFLHHVIFPVYLICEYLSFSIAIIEYSHHYDGVLLSFTLILFGERHWRWWAHVCVHVCVCMRECECVHVCICRTKRDRIVPGRPIRSTMHSM